MPREPVPAQAKVAHKDATPEVPVLPLGAGQRAVLLTLQLAVVSQGLVLASQLCTRALPRPSHAFVPLALSATLKVAAFGVLLLGFQRTCHSQPQDLRIRQEAFSYTGTARLFLWPFAGWVTRRWSQVAPSGFYLTQSGGVIDLRLLTTFGERLRLGSHGASAHPWPRLLEYLENARLGERTPWEQASAAHVPISAPALRTVVLLAQLLLLLHVLWRPEALVWQCACVALTFGLLGVACYGAHMRGTKPAKGRKSHSAFGWLLAASMAGLAGLGAGGCETPQPDAKSLARLVELVSRKPADNSRVGKTRVHAELGKLSPLVAAVTWVTQSKLDASGPSYHQAGHSLVYGADSLVKGNLRRTLQIRKGSATSALERVGPGPFEPRYVGPTGDIAYLQVQGQQRQLMLRRASAPGNKAVQKLSSSAWIGHLSSAKARPLVAFDSSTSTTRDKPEVILLEPSKGLHMGLFARTFPAIDASGRTLACVSPKGQLELYRLAPTAQLTRRYTRPGWTFGPGAFDPSGRYLALQFRPISKQKTPKRPGFGLALVDTQRGDVSVLVGRKVLRGPMDWAGETLAVGVRRKGKTLDVAELVVKLPKHQ